jgi:hypothetical protein
VVIVETKHHSVSTHRAVHIRLVVVATNSYGISNGSSECVGLGWWLQIALNLGSKLVRLQW